jgi:hypothetical protein
VKKAIAIGAVALAIVLALVVMLPMLMFAGQPDATAACGTAAPAAGAISVPVGSTAGLTARQLQNAGTIIAAARGNPAVGDKGAVVMLVASLQEDDLQNSTVSDNADSLGLFQMRPSMGWGSVAQITDPTWASEKFITVLLAVPGWQSMDPGAAAQAVERSAFPGAYTPHLGVAEALIANAGGSTTSVTVPIAAACPPAAVAAAATGADPGPGPQGADHLTPRMIALKAAVKVQFPQFTDVGCWRASDPYPDHPSGRACDFMIPGLGHDQAGEDLGNQLADWVQANAKAFGLQYEIFRQRYRPAGTDWAPMTDRGGWTANHMDHVHVTVLS